MNETKENEYLTREETMELFKKTYNENVNDYDDEDILMEDIIDYLLEMNADPNTINELRYSQ